ncbi:unnamed protein product [Protopolystoma xenopodis]|uniref:Uncharacterized protein n=1 Tax=Protopolystoma xenopodis TaxID=117903 RepID=A0A448XEQ0_9PLAT|nr:unnamed protein product [Protopolystoma xenopodis]
MVRPPHCVYADTAEEAGTGGGQKVCLAGFGVSSTARQGRGPEQVAEGVWSGGCGVIRSPLRSGKGQLCHPLHQNLASKPIRSTRRNVWTHPPHPRLNRHNWTKAPSQVQSCRPQSSPSFDHIHTHTHTQSSAQEMPNVLYTHSVYSFRINTHNLQNSLSLAEIPRPPVHLAVVHGRDSLSYESHEILRNPGLRRADKTTRPGELTRRGVWGKTRSGRSGETGCLFPTTTIWPAPFCRQTNPPSNSVTDFTSCRLDLATYRQTCILLPSDTQTD